MRLLPQLLARDLRRLWPCLLPWVVVQAAHLSYFWLSTYNHCEGLHFEWLVTAFNVLWACLVTCFQFKEESPVETLAGWRLRPIDPRLQCAGRWLAVVLLVIVAPLVISLPVWLYWGANAEELRRGFAYVLEVYGFGMLIAAIGSCFIGDRRRRTLRFTVPILSVIVSFLVLAWVIKPLWFKSEWSWALWMLVGGLSGLLLTLSYWLHARPPLRQGLRACVGLVSLGCILGLFGELGRLSSLFETWSAAPRGSVVPQLSYEVYRTQWTKTRSSQSTFVLFMLPRKEKLGGYVRWLSPRVTLRNGGQVVDMDTRSPFKLIEALRALSDDAKSNASMETLEAPVGKTSFQEGSQSSSVFSYALGFGYAPTWNDPVCQIEGQFEWGHLSPYGELPWPTTNGRTLQKMGVLHFWSYRPQSRMASYPKNQVWLSYFVPACHTEYALRFQGDDGQLHPVSVGNLEVCHLLGLPWLIKRCSWTGVRDGLSWDESPHGWSLPRLLIFERIPEGRAWQSMKMPVKPIESLDHETHLLFQ